MEVESSEAFCLGVFHFVEEIVTAKAAVWPLLLTRAPQLPVNIKVVESKNYDGNVITVYEKKQDVSAIRE